MTAPKLSRVTIEAYARAAAVEQIPGDVCVPAPVLADLCRLALRALDEPRAEAVSSLGAEPNRIEPMAGVLGPSDAAAEGHHSAVSAPAERKPPYWVLRWDEDGNWLTGDCPATASWTGLKWKRERFATRRAAFLARGWGASWSKFSRIVRVTPK